MTTFIVDDEGVRVNVDQIDSYKSWYSGVLAFVGDRNHDFDLSLSDFEDMLRNSAKATILDPAAIKADYKVGDIVELVFKFQDNVEPGLLFKVASLVGGNLYCTFYDGKRVGGWVLEREWVKPYAPQDTPVDEDAPKIGDQVRITDEGSVWQNYVGQLVDIVNRGVNDRYYHVRLNVNSGKTIATSVEKR